MHPQPLQQDIPISTSLQVSATATHGCSALRLSSWRPFDLVALHATYTHILADLDEECYCACCRGSGAFATHALSSSFQAQRVQTCRPNPAVGAAGRSDFYRPCACKDLQFLGCMLAALSLWNNILGSYCKRESATVHATGIRMHLQPLH